MAEKGKGFGRSSFVETAVLLDTEVDREEA